MQAASRHPNGTATAVLVATGLFCLLGICSPLWLATAEPFLVLGMLLVLGLPHGATDHGLFTALPATAAGNRRMQFYLGYSAALALYAATWYVFPVVAFVLFLLLSFYHFGQSNWVGTDIGAGWVLRGHYLLWGAGVLLTPILLHADQATAIVAFMTGYAAPPLTVAFVEAVITVFAVANVSVILTLGWQRRISKRRCAREVLGYGLLMALFLTNGLLLGFTVYFVLWHSVSSIRDQLAFFRSRLPRRERRRLYLEIGAVVVGAVVFCAVIWLGPGPAAALRPEIIGRVFIGISILTLPHMLLVEQLYRHWSTNKLTIAHPADGVEPQRPDLGAIATDATVG